MAGSDLAGLVIGLGANTASLQSDFNTGLGYAQKFSADVSAAIGKIGANANLSGVSTQVQGLTSDFDKLKSVVSTVFSVGLGVGGLRELEELADNYQNVSNRIKTTTADSEQFAAASQRVFEIAQQTSRSLDDTAKTYQRVEQAIAATGVSQTQAQQQALSITKTLNEEIVVSGASAGEASRAIMDLVHGLAGGEIQARQFNQVMRQMPDLGKQIAQGLGVSVEQLEKMVHAGLPAQTLLKALANQAGDIDDKFNALPKTFSQTWNVLSNAVEKYVGEAAQASAVTGILKAAIIGIADNIKFVGAGAEAVAAAMALWLGGKGLTALGSLAGTLKDAVLAQGEYKTALQLTAEGEIAAAEATVKATTATIARLDAENDLRVAKLSELQATQQSLISEQAELEARQRSLAVGVNVLATEERLIAVRTELAGTTTKIATLEDAMAASQARATLAEQAETGATAALAESKVALATAQAGATSATGLFARAGAGLFALIGGWTTVLIAAAAGIYYLATAETEAEKESDKLAKVTKEVTDAHANMTPTLQKNAEALYTEAAALVEATNQRIAYLQAQQDSLSKGAAQPAALAAMSDEMNRASKESEVLTARMNDLAGAILKSKLAAAGKSLYEALFPDIRSAMAQIDALTDGIDKQSDHFAKMAATYGKGNAATVEWEKSQELAKLSVGQTEEAIVKITAALDEKYAADIKNAAAADAATAAHKAYTKALTEQQRALQDYNTDIGKLSDVEEQLSSGLGGPYLAALKAYQKEIDLTAKTWGDAVGAGTANAELFDRLMTVQEQAEKQLQATNKQLDKQHDVLAKYMKQIGQENALAGLTDREKAIAQAVQKVTDEYEKNTDAGVKNKQSLADLTASVSAAAAATFDLQKTANDVKDFAKEFGDVSPFEKLTKGIEEVGEALEKAMGAGATDRIKELQKTIGGIRQSLVEGIVKSSQDGLRSLQSMTTEGSNAFKAMQIAIDALTLVQAVSAILNQGQGDPYSAFARMAAMAAAVVALGVDIAGFGGGGGASAQSAEQVQKKQGTGTVLGDAAAQSDSIAKSIDITAKATTQLVGLNRGMLNALNNLQAGLGAAGVQIARGANNVPAPSLSGGLDIPGDPLGSKIFGALFGGKQKIIDQGITIAGGVLSDMINSIAVGAYTTVHTSGGLFSSGKDKQVVTDITDEFGKQFSLVIKSIADTVKQGALALGLLPADVQKALDDYQVAAINISLKGLSADDQQKALEAVFSSIFDGVAGAVVPFIGQFQQVGEGLGETLVRIATEVQVTQEGFKQLGLSISQTDPEKFAQISDALIKASGGIDDFISGMQSFVDNFSSDSNKLAISGASIASAFSQVGLTVPATRDGMWELMQSLDATTDAGRAQIATLLRLSDASAAYYDQIDAFNKTLGIGQESDLHAQLKSIRDAAVGLVKALTAAGASSDTLQKVYSAAVDKMNEVIAALQESAQELAFSLGLTTKGSLDQVNQEISSLESKANGGASAISGFGSAITKTSQAATDAMNLLLGELSPLNDQQKLQTALNGLRGGTATADQVLEIGRRLYASSEAYTTLFNTVKNISHTKGGGSSFVGSSGTTTGSSSGLDAEDQQRLKQLLAEQQTLQASQTLSQYQTLAQQIAEIASAKQESWQDVLKEMDIQAGDLEKGLGLANDDALDAYIKTVQTQVDSATENTSSIVDAILALPNAIAAAFAGTLPVAGSGSQGPYNTTQPNKFGGPSTPPGTGDNGTAQPVTNPGNGNGSGGGNNGPVLSPHDYTGIGNAVVQGMLPTVNGIVNLPSRNLRREALVR